MSDEILADITEEQTVQKGFKGRVEPCRMM